MKKVIPEELSNYIESLDYETQAYKNVIAFLSRDKFADEANLKFYTELYDKAYASFEIAKREMAESQGITGDWSLDYATHTVTTMDFDKFGAKYCYGE